MRWVSIVFFYISSGMAWVVFGDHLCNISSFLVPICLHQTDIKGWPWKMHICRLKSDLETNKNLVEICTGITLCYVYMHPEDEIASKIIDMNMWCHKWYHITFYFSSISLMWTFLPEMPFFFLCTDANSEASQILLKLLVDNGVVLDPRKLKKAPG